MIKTYVLDEVCVVQRVAERSLNLSDNKGRLSNVLETDKDGDDGASRELCKGSC